MPLDQSFRHQVLRGSAYLSFRLAAGAGIGIIGISLLTRFIGPTNYGIFTAAHPVLSYTVTLTEYGVGVYLLRLDRDAPDEFHQALTLLLIFSAGGVLLVLGVIILIEHAFDLREIRFAIFALIMGLPVVHLVKVPMARLERNLDYRRVAMIELVSNVGYYIVALAVAYRGGGIGAPVAGWWAQQLIQLVQVYHTGYRPRLLWRGAIAKRMLSFHAESVRPGWIPCVSSNSKVALLRRILPHEYSSGLSKFARCAASGAFCRELDQISQRSFGQLRVVRINARFGGKCHFTQDRAAVYAVKIYPHKWERARQLFRRGKHFVVSSWFVYSAIGLKTRLGIGELCRPLAIVKVEHDT
jgi:hypothetical protein